MGRKNSKKKKSKEKTTPFTRKRAERPVGYYQVRNGLCYD